MKNNIKKWAVVIGCLVICAVMVGLIGNSFTKPPAQDDLIMANDPDESGVTVGSGAEAVTFDPGAETVSDGKDPVVVRPDTSIPDHSGAGNGAVYTGTVQTIQPDVKKPVYDETLEDPTKTPDGTPVGETPKHGEQDAVVTPPPATNTSQPQGGEKQNGKIYVPGFGWIDDNGGGGQGETIGSEGDINKMVGVMGG